LGTFLAGIWIVFLVWGFTPLRASLSITWKVPKPTNVTFSFLSSESVIADVIASITLLASFFVRPTLPTTSSTHSALFIVCPLLFTRIIAGYFGFFTVSLKSSFGKELTFSFPGNRGHSMCSSGKGKSIQCHDYDSNTGQRKNNTQNPGKIADHPHLSYQEVFGGNQKRLLHNG